MTPISPVTGWSPAGCATAAMQSRKHSPSKCYNSVVDLFLRSTLAYAAGLDLRRVDVVRTVQRQPIVFVTRLFTAGQLQTGIPVRTAGIVHLVCSHTVRALARRAIPHPKEELVVHSATPNRVRDCVRFLSYAGLCPASSIDRVSHFARDGIGAFPGAFAFRFPDLLAAGGVEPRAGLLPQISGA